MIRLLAIDLDCQESHTPTLSQHEADAIYALRAARIDLAILTSDPDALKRELVQGEHMPSGIHVIGASASSESLRRSLHQLMDARGIERSDAALIATQPRDRALMPAVGQTVALADAGSACTDSANAIAPARYDNGLSQALMSFLD